ncbi:MAG: DUF2007 domain-containing protein [Archangium sp.]
MRATVFTTTDRIEAQALLALLRGAGIEAELIGVADAARVGVGEIALPLHIEVDAEDEAQARELIAAKPELEPAQEEEKLRPPLSRKRPIIALGVPVVWPGLGHIYAGHPYTGVPLMLGVLASFVGAAANSNLAAAYAVLLILDAFFARRAVLAFNEGRHRGAGAQLGAGMAMVVFAFLLTGAGPALEKWQRARERAELSTLEVTCTRSRLSITNTADSPREVEFRSLVSVRVGILLADKDMRGVQFRGGRSRVLEPHETLALDIEDDASPFVTSITTALQPQRAFELDVVVRREASEPGVRGTFSCTPRG